MADAPKSSWIYHPLDGNELLKWIFADAWEKLRANGQFQAHLSYHNPTYLLKLEVQAYDASAKGVTNGALAEAMGGLQTSEEQLIGSRIKLDTMEANSEQPLKEPDKGRELIDEGRYKTVSDGGILVDKKVKAKKKEDQ
jgi:hypothetical protein